jgi:uncharacterized membrane protein
MRDNTINFMMKHTETSKTAIRRERIALSEAHDKYRTILRDTKHKIVRLLALFLIYSLNVTLMSEKLEKAKKKSLAVHIQHWLSVI